MTNNSIALKPTFWASISGGKDSYFMLQLILKNPDKYPLHGVVYFDLEIDYPFIKNVISKIKSECIKYNIPLFSIKPDVSYYDLYNKYKFPSARVRWCNGMYKLNARRKFEKLQEQYGNSVNWYIGFCSDETHRIKIQEKNCYYPLIDFDIEEKYILEWAKNQDVYNNYYKSSKRCGCMWCPLSSMIEKAYLLKYYPVQYNEMIRLMLDTEISIECKTGKSYTAFHGNYDTAYLDHIIKTKWLKKLDQIENDYNNVQLSIFDD